MTDWMVRIRDADLRIRTIVLLARELECDDACDIGLERQNLQVEHELRVVGELRGDSYRPIEVTQLGIHYRLLRALDLTLNLANAVEILIHAHPIGNANALLQPRDIHAEGIKQ